MLHPLYGQKNSLKIDVIERNTPMSNTYYRVVVNGDRDEALKLHQFATNFRCHEYTSGNLSDAFTGYRPVKIFYSYLFHIDKRHELHYDYCMHRDEDCSYLYSTVTVDEFIKIYIPRRIQK